MKYAHCRIALLGLLSAAGVARSQAAPARDPIADNSFLIEEAYNQDPGVVQHISLFQKARAGNAWSYTFTQEWPVRGQRNQFSYSVPLSHQGANRSGVGDVMLNWRFQAVGSNDAPTWVAPRLSLVLPTGDNSKGLGSGVLGVQAVIPVSHRINEAFVSHTNAGVTVLPNAKDPTGRSGTATTISIGQSVVWQPLIRTNFTLEAVWDGTTRTVGTAKSWDATFYVSPGIRWAYDCASGLQVVPGIAFPIGVGPSRDDNQIMLYLSFEHPFGSRR